MSKKVLSVEISLESMIFSSKGSSQSKVPGISRLVVQESLLEVEKDEKAAILDEQEKNICLKIKS